MVSSQLPQGLTVEITIQGPGGDPIGDCRIVGFAGGVSSFSGSVGTPLVIPVLVANDNPGKAYKVVDAIAERVDGASVVSDVPAPTVPLPAGVLDTQVDVTLVPLASVRGSKSGTYRIFLLVDEA